MKSNESDIGLIKDFLANVWERICGIRDCDIPEFVIRIKKIIFWFAVTAGVALIIFTLGILVHWNWLMFFSVMPLLIMIGLAYWAPIFLVKLLTGATEAAGEIIAHKKAEEVAEQMKKLGLEIKKLVAPLVMTAAVLAFINAYVQLNGFGCVTWTNFLVFTSAVVALALLSKKFKQLPTIVMTASLLVSLTLWYARVSDDPVACALNNKVQQYSLHLQSDNSKYYGIVKEDKTVVYHADLKGGNIAWVAECKGSLPKGALVQVLDQKAKRYDNDLYLHVRLLNQENKLGCWIQLEKIEVAKMKVEPGKYALVKQSSKILWWGNDSWKIYFLSDKPIEISLVPREAVYSFSGIKPGELYISLVNTPSVDTLVPATINTDLFNTALNITLRAAAGKMVILNTRGTTSKEKAKSDDWLRTQQVVRM